MPNTLTPNPEMVDNENPEWTDEMFVQAKHASDFPELQGLLKASRGRPKVENPKKTISIRLSNDTLEFFKSTGKGWQTRIDEILTKYAASH
jgi:uncharacterized protein (DUF4415 family)